ncbi:hypothetical protein BKA70DRAFT_1471176 [Coprinopsis sp. MPI-PUGE-AT-0042]|nr:hypothetical protein BKA70DRAFT_1471176 [Coprinopsis sp. MPI-PUGE-AT-0042]
METANPNSGYRPVRLASYFSTNNVLSSTGIPTLGHYLFQLKGYMKGIENEISDLQAVIDAKKEEHERFEEEHGITASLRHPIRSVPPEVLGNIFAFAVGESPFNGFVARLRAVCSRWGEVALTTPGLWTRLSINVDKWSKVRVVGDLDKVAGQIKQELSLWLAILHRSKPYRLVLAAEAEDPRLDGPSLDYQERLVHYLLGAEPKPGFVIIESAVALLSVIHFPSACPSVTEMKITEEANDKQEGWKLEEQIFPNLTFVLFCGSIAYCYSQFALSFLQSLYLDITDGQPHDLKRILANLPALRELNIKRKEDEWIDDTFAEDTQLYICPPFTGGPNSR